MFQDRDKLVFECNRPDDSSILTLSHDADACLASRLNDATFRLDADGSFVLNLQSEPGKVEILVKPERANTAYGKSVYGITVQARPIDSRANLLYRLSSFKFDVVELSTAESQDPIESQERTSGMLCAGPFEVGRTYLIRVLRPPFVLRSAPENPLGAPSSRCSGPRRGEPGYDQLTPPTMPAAREGVLISA